MRPLICIWELPSFYAMFVVGCGGTGRPLGSYIQSSSWVKSNPIVEKTFAPHQKNHLHQILVKIHGCCVYSGHWFLSLSPFSYRPLGYQSNRSVSKGGEINSFGVVPMAQETFVPSFSSTLFIRHYCCSPTNGTLAKVSNSSCGGHSLDGK